MIHTLAKEYGWSKNQVDEVYPEEAVVMLKFLAFERKDELLAQKLDYYRHSVDAIHIQHGDPDKLRASFVDAIQKIQNASVLIKNATMDDDLPDYARLKALRDHLKNQQ